MSFELTGALIDSILFSMEDQNRKFLVDTRKGVVIEQEKGSPDAEAHRIPLPEWDSSDGYRLMERFAAGFKNPLIQNKLNAALDRGKGVFRAFKDVLSDHPEVEQRWFSFKEREMKRAIIRWYNALREGWGLDHIGMEPEETDDLVLEDFQFRDAREEDIPKAAELHRYYSGEDPGGTWNFPGSAALVAETGNGEFAAYIAVLREGETLRISALEVRPEYRGLGLGEALLDRFCGEELPVALDLPVSAEWFSRALLRRCFKPVLTRYVRYPGS
jgi:GNAT superfamily N-acetyltransferase